MFIQRLSISLLSTIVLSFYAVAESSEKSFCAQLKRPNIDCACVSKRLGGFKAVSGSKKIHKLLDQRYAYALGLENQLETAERAYRSDSMEVIQNEMAYEPFGGMPEIIEDFELGCVIDTAKTANFVTPANDSYSAKFVEARTRSLGEEYRRDSLCMQNRMQAYLSEQEIGAYHLSFSYYEGDHNNNDTKSRASKMGVSVPIFENLERSARSKLTANQEVDSTYCNAMTYMERFSKQKIEADRKAEMARFASIGSATTEAPSASNKNVKTPSTMTAGQGTSELQKAYSVAQSGCRQEGYSDSQCQCVLEDIKQKVASNNRPGVVMFWVTIRYGSSLNPIETMQLMQTADPQDRNEAAQLFATTNDVGEACQLTAHSSESLTGTPEERMTQICMADVADASICACMVGKMKGQLNDDDFELLVDLREAEFSGADDPLLVVAEQRGLTRTQAEQALGNNKNLIGGMMNLDMLSCVGGLPDMSKLPGLQGIPEQ